MTINDPNRHKDANGFAGIFAGSKEDPEKEDPEEEQQLSAILAITGARDREEVTVDPDIYSHGIPMLRVPRGQPADHVYDYATDYDATIREVNHGSAVELFARSIPRPNQQT